MEVASVITDDGRLDTVDVTEDSVGERYSRVRDPDGKGISLEGGGGGGMDLSYRLPFNGCKVTSGRASGLEEDVEAPVWAGDSSVGDESSSLASSIPIPSLGVTIERLSR
jgi:hypothetical protein